VDRYYVDAFLGERARDIAGRVLEIRDRRYTERWGADVTASDVLDIDPDLPGVTLVADLTADTGLPADAYDCFIVTQTLQFLYDVEAAVRNAHRLLAPGGVLLVTVPVVSRICRVEGTEIDHWRFTVASCERLFGEVFGPDRVSVEARGNLRSTIAFLRGMAWQELPASALAKSDPLYPLVVCVRAQKG
jgi:SAM-dependent methyltransferase